MRLLALDPSSINTGYALYTDEDLTEYGNINLIKRAPDNSKTMVKKLWELLDKIRPDYIVFEKGLLLYRGYKTADTLNRVFYAIETWAINNDTEYSVYIPTSWRKELKDEKLNNKAKTPEIKKWDIDKCNEIFKLQITDDNIADAILIGKSHLIKMQNDNHSEISLKARA